MTPLTKPHDFQNTYHYYNRSDTEINFKYGYKALRIL